MAKLKASNTKRLPRVASHVLDRRGRALSRFEAKRIRSEVGELWRKVRKEGAVTITREGAPVAVMLSAEGFLDLLFSPKPKRRKASRRR